MNLSQSPPALGRPQSSSPEDSSVEQSTIQWAGEFVDRLQAREDIRPLSNEWCRLTHQVNQCVANASQSGDEITRCLATCKQHKIALDQHARSISARLTAWGQTVCAFGSGLAAAAWRWSIGDVHPLEHPGVSLTLAQKTVKSVQGLTGVKVGLAVAGGTVALLVFGSLKLWNPREKWKSKQKKLKQTYQDAAQELARKNLTEQKIEDTLQGQQKRVEASEERACQIFELTFCSGLETYKEVRDKYICMWEGSGHRSHVITLPVPGPNGSYYERECCGPGQLIDRQALGELLSTQLQAIMGIASICSQVNDDFLLRISNVFKERLQGQLGHNVIPFCRAPDPLRHRIVTHDEYATLSREVYKKDKANLPTHWEVYHDSDEYDLSRDGFYGTAYVDRIRGRIVVAFRGTENIHDYLTDVFLALGQPDLQFSTATKFFKEIQRIAHGESPDYRLSLTGHSLGGAQAEYVGFICKVKSVTFDSPGVGLIVAQEMEQQKTRVWQGITSYLSIPNIVNTCQRHIGRRLHVWPTITDQKVSFPSNTNPSAKAFAKSLVTLKPLDFKILRMISNVVASLGSSQKFFRQAFAVTLKRHKIARLAKHLCEGPCIKGVKNWPVGWAQYCQFERRFQDDLHGEQEGLGFPTFGLDEARIVGYELEGEADRVGDTEENFTEEQRDFLAAYKDPSSSKYALAHRFAVQIGIHPVMLDACVVDQKGQVRMEPGAWSLEDFKEHLYTCVSDRWDWEYHMFERPPQFAESSGPQSLSHGGSSSSRSSR